ncbi:MAG TPA: lysophospholipid acyltransferase family protein [Terrimicrobiaceae bacterium]
MSAAKPHTERWAYRRLYSASIFELATRMYPLFHRSGAQIISRTVAWTYAVTQHAIRRIVRENLSLLQKEPVSERDAIAVFVNFGATIADYVAVGALPSEKALALCAENQGIEHLWAATESGRGVILATGHFSFFEFGAVVLGRMGRQVTIATLPEPSDELTAWRAGWRQRWGTETIAVGTDPFSSLQVARAIEEGRCMAMLADRPMAEHGISCDLPNGRTMISSSPALLSWMTGCKILPVVVTRLSDGRYRITAKPAVEARRVSHGERDEEIARCTRELGVSLFEEIRRAPLQWYQFVPVGL